MNREIKFRAWLPGPGEYMQNVHNVTRFCELLALDTIIVEQYTGLRDKNGVEIYEGDIVDVGYDDEYSPATVVFYEGAFCKRYPYWDDTIRMPYLNPQEIKILQLEIIGNIHENPELLESGSTDD